MSTKNNQTKPVGLLYDSVSPNTGDIAIGLALQQVLKKRRIDSEVVDPFYVDPTRYSTLIIGGGELLRDPGTDFYDVFRAKGQYILNSVGVDSSKDFGYLKDYLYVSSRSQAEANLLEQTSSLKVNVIPCTTTLLESKKYQIKGLAKARQQTKKVVGIHLVPDVLIKCPDIIQIINDIPHTKVLIPFTHYNHDYSFMNNLPLDRSNVIMLDKLAPLELHSTIAQMDYVIVSSLHASIFAYSQNVPFVSMYQNKAYNYFKDRKLDHFIYKSQDELKNLISYVDGTQIDMSEQISRDKELVNKTIDNFAELISGQALAGGSGSSRAKPAPDSQIQRLKLRIDQLEAVIAKRDNLTHNIIYQDMRSAEEKLNVLRHKIADLEDDLQKAKKKQPSYWIKRGAQEIQRKVGK